MSAMPQAAEAITESPLAFNCDDSMLFGVVAAPAPGITRSGLGVVVVVGGPQYRAGSHRQFVLLCRALAQQGHVCLRFDVRGMGDSEGLVRDFLSLDDDIAAAIDALAGHAPALRSVLLWGLCDGASAALLYCGRRRDTRIGALCLLNPWVRSETSLARAQIKHYYLRRLQQGAFWRKLLSGQVAGQALRDLLANLRMVSKPRTTTALRGSYQQQMGQAWAAFGGPILLILSEDDHVSKEFQDHIGADAAWSGALSKPGVSRLDMPDTDHTFSNTVARQGVEQETLLFLRGL